MSLAALAIICFGHFVSDFVLQARWMAVNKGRHLDALAFHIAQYSVSMAAICWPLLVWFLSYEPNGTFALWIVLNAAAHFIVDLITSRITAYAHAQKREKLFWGTIGADQLSHQVCLFGTYVLLGLP